MNIGCCKFYKSNGYALYTQTDRQTDNTRARARESARVDYSKYKG